LVLDSVDSSLSSPVNTTVVDVGLIQLGNFHTQVLWDWAESEPLLVLLLSHGREHVVTKSERVLLVVPLVDHDVLGFEQVQSEFVLLSGSKGKTLILNMGSELLLKLISGLLLVEEVLESEHGCSFHEVHHL